ncbi:MAG: hypothetical protein QOE90_1839 [Thermoplasmata archaeon]|nr:hypothetical protein [Thermoplasmata archaeon]
MLGTLTLRGEEMAWKPEAEGPVDAHAGETLELVVSYSYEEPSNDKDETRVALSAEMSGAKLGRVEDLIDDSKVRDDSMRSYVALPFRLQRRGEMDLAWTIRVAYTRTPWTSKTPTAKADLEERGTLKLKVV